MKFSSALASSGNERSVEGLARYRDTQRVPDRRVPAGTAELEAHERNSAEPAGQLAKP
jgi:hypothetical protein